VNEAAPASRLHLFECFLKEIYRRKLKFGGKISLKGPPTEIPTDEDMLHIVKEHPIIYTVTMQSILVNPEGIYFHRAQELRKKRILPTVAGEGGEEQEEEGAAAAKDEKKEEKEEKENLSNKAPKDAAGSSIGKQPPSKTEPSTKIDSIRYKLSFALLLLAFI
jgi:hypothetical protein